MMLCLEVTASLSTIFQPVSSASDTFQNVLQNTFSKNNDNQIIHTVNNVEIV